MPQILLEILNDILKNKLGRNVLIYLDAIKVLARMRRLASNFLGDRPDLKEIKILRQYAQLQFLHNKASVLGPRY